MTDSFGAEGAARCAVWRTGTVLSLAGVIDEFNRVEIADRVAAEVVSGVDHLELTAVTLFGAAGVRVLLHGLGAAPDGRLSVTGTPLACRVLDICGLLNLDGLTVVRAAAGQLAREE